MDSAPESGENLPPRNPREKMIALIVFFAVPMLLPAVATVVEELNYSSLSSSGNEGDGEKMCAAARDGDPYPAAAAAPVVNSSSNSSHDHSAINSVIRSACANTLYPSLCFSTLSSSSSALSSEIQSAPTFGDVLEIGINETAKFIQGSQDNITDLLRGRYSTTGPQEKSALQDCLEMLDQSLYELKQGVHDLRRRHDDLLDEDEGGLLRGGTRRSSSKAAKKYSNANLKTLLSAALTNEHTCIAGFSELEQRSTESPFLFLGDDDYDSSAAEKSIGDHKGPEEYIHDMLTPISQMISNCLAIIKYAETTAVASDNHNKGEEEELDQRLLLKEEASAKETFPDWVAPGDQKLMERGASNVKADAVVASDGTGHYRSIAKAVRMAAPNGRSKRFVIRIKAGTYRENVAIPRNKVNIMLIGDGMNSTVITGSRNSADGFSTFTSATLTVVGDGFLARDLSIENAAGPSKHQAVAVRVTSNAAFYRCNFASHQDTLYVHSLRQFYRECTIQGTIDFIFGNAAAIFESCTIVVRKPGIPGQQTVITAQGREDPNQNTGISLQNCTVRAAPDLRRLGATTFLGRPWRNYSRTVVMKSYLGALIHPEGWCRWDNYTNLNTLRYIEYMNTGPGSNTSRRIAWPGYQNNCSERVAEQFTSKAFFRDGAADHWLKSASRPLMRGHVACVLHSVADCVDPLYLHVPELIMLYLLYRCNTPTLA